jgi:cardiolipin synthase
VNPATRTKLFTRVDTFYSDLLKTLPSARERITMMYFTFDSGEWSGKLAEALVERAAAGVRVQLMVDGFGLALDAPRHTFRNLRLLEELKAAGVEVERFQPGGHRLTWANRLHTKVCAIDDGTVYIGGSNIGDHYPRWHDHNLRLDGELGSAFHEVYEYIRRHATARGKFVVPDFHLSRLYAGGARILLTVPKQRWDIRRALLDLILDADKEITIRSWYFLPDREILNALRSQAQRGVSVNILLSHRTRVPVIDWANHIHGHKLSVAGGNVYRFTGGFMHAKAAWNDRGAVLFGSANLDAKALKDNFECSLLLEDADLARQLGLAFEADLAECCRQSSDYLSRRSLPVKALAYACSLVSPWL